MKKLFVVLMFLTPVAHAATWQPALPGYQFQFPRDHGAHPKYQTEWWYFTGHLQAKQRRFGYELTFFRTSLLPQTPKRASRWATSQIIFAHFALTDETGQKFYATDRISRAALKLAGADAAGAKSPRVFLGSWAVKFGGKTGEQQNLNAVGSDSQSRAPFALSLQTRAVKPVTKHGKNGVSQKSAGKGQASHYYSYCRLETRGKLRIGQQTFQVVGQSWFDHEFGSSQLAKNQVGWDWFAVQLNDGRELMLYHLRLKNGGTDPYSSGTLIEKNGRARFLKRSEFRIVAGQTWRSPRSGAKYPARWTLELGRENLRLEVVPTVANQELDTRRSTGITYWEGSADVSGTQRGKALKGRAYVELTGYAKPFNTTF